jgi:phosphate-selective porin OprO/OprP
MPRPRLVRNHVSAVLLGAAFAVATAHADTAKVNGLLSFESDDHNFSASIGGRLQQDWVFATPDTDAEDELGLRAVDGVSFRRARLFASGKMYGNIAYKAEFDFVNGKVAPTDLYIQLRNLPFGNLRVGHFYEPFSLEELTSDNYITFMERSVMSVFVPQRNTGIAAFNAVADKRVTWGVGIFRDDAGSDPATTTEGGNYAETARVTGLPVWNEESRTFVHLGVAGSHRRPPHHTRSYSFRPEVNQVPSVLSTGALDIDDLWLLGCELAFVTGPLCVQGEAVVASHTGIAEEVVVVPARHAGESHDPTFGAYYAYASFFLTGESRPYDRDGGVFGRVKPRRNFGDGSGGAGAFELAARISSVDLDDPDAEVAAGKMSNVTVGLHWYLNPQTRVSNDFVLSDIEDGLGNEGKVQTFQTRFQIDF